MSFDIAKAWCYAPLMDTEYEYIMKLHEADKRRSAAGLSQEVDLATFVTSDRAQGSNVSEVTTTNHTFIGPFAELELCAFLFVDLEPHIDEHVFIETVLHLSQVREVHHITGSYSWLMKIQVRNAAELRSLLTHHFKLVSGIRRIETLVVLDTVKEI